VWSEDTCIAYQKNLHRVPGFYADQFGDNCWRWELQEQRDKCRFDRASIKQPKKAGTYDSQSVTGLHSYTLSTEDLTAVKVDMIPEDGADWPTYTILLEFEVSSDYVTYNALGYTYHQYIHQNAHIQADQKDDRRGYQGLGFQEQKVPIKLYWELGRMQILDLYVGLGLKRRKNSFSLFKTSWFLYRPNTWHAQDLAFPPSCVRIRRHTVLGVHYCRFLTVHFHFLGLITNPWIPKAEVEETETELKIIG